MKGKINQLETKPSGSPNLYLQQSQPKFWHTVTQLSRTLVFGHFGIDKQEVM